MTDTADTTETAGPTDAGGARASNRRSARRAAQTRLGREHVLDAAEEVFSRKGFHEATIKEIAGVAEFSVGAVYGFVDNKDDLFIQVMERRGAELVPAMRDLLAGPGTGGDKLHRLADLQIDFFREHPAFARLFVRSTGAPLLNIKTSLGDATRERYDEAMALQAGLFRDGQAAGELVGGAPEVLAEVFSGIILAFQSHDPEVLAPDAPDAPDDPADGPDRAGEGDGPPALTLDELHGLLDRAFVVSPSER